MGEIFLPINFGKIEIVKDLDFAPIALHNLKIIFYIIAGGVLWSIPSVGIFSWNTYISLNWLASFSSSLNWYLIFLIHGIPEFIGQFFALLASFNISVFLWHTFFGKKYSSLLLWKIFKLIILAFLLTFIAGFLEVYVTVPIAKTYLN